MLYDRLLNKMPSGSVSGSSTLYKPLISKRIADVQTLRFDVCL